MGRKGRLESEPQVRDLYDGGDSGTFIRSEERPAEKGTLRAERVMEEFPYSTVTD